MKFANLYYKRSGRLTIGDDMQILAVENLYHSMGIDDREIIRIGYHELADYQGEYALLPVSFPLYGFHYELAITQFSPKIVPVFLGLSIIDSNLSVGDLEYLRQYAPIGCRDEHTLKIMRKYHIMSYFNGCITATFPRRRNNAEGNYTRVIGIDVPESFKKNIPDSLLENCEFISHMYYNDELKESSEEFTRKQYELYINEAKLIITTRLHAALPCAAAGIPVIFFKDHFSFRFSGTEKLIKIYTESEYEEIDWNPEAIEFEREKRMILDAASQRIRDTYNKYKSIYGVSEFYEDRNKKLYYVEFIDNTIDYLQKHWNKNEGIPYVLWGVTQTAHMVFDYISKTFPHAKLMAVIDAKKRLEFCGVRTCGNEWLEVHSDVFVFVCTGAAIKESYQIFKKYNINQFYQCCEDGEKHKQEKEWC